MTAFVVPFAFVYNNGILLTGDAWHIAFSCIAVTGAVACLCLAAEGFWKHPIGTMSRLLFLAAGIGLMAPSLTLQSGGGAIAVVTMLVLLREGFASRQRA